MRRRLDHALCPLVSQICEAVEGPGKEDGGRGVEEKKCSIDGKASQREPLPSSFEIESKLNGHGEEEDIGSNIVKCWKVRQDTRNSYAL